MNSRDAILNIWNAVVVFFSVLYLTNSASKAGILAVFVLISCLIGYGRRWQLRAGFAVTVLAFVVALGILPNPQIWPPLVSEIKAMLAACIR